MNMKHFIYLLLLFFRITYVYSENEINTKNSKNLRTAICSIAKMENNYINDWCRYHFDLGFDEIYIYDNNDENYEPVESRIDKDMISRVHIIKVPGIRKDFQLSAYNSFIKENYTKYDWCAFIDLDEFFVLKHWNNIKEFLSQKIFEKVDEIKFEWHLYGDNDEIKQDLSIPIYKRIKKEVFPYYRGGHLCKPIIKGNKQFLFENPHFVKNFDKTNCYEVNIHGEYLNNTGKFVDRRYEDAYIAHYMTKTLDEFINQKFKRIEHNYDNSIELMSNEDPYVRFQYFFYVNEETSEKLAYIKEKLNVDFIEKEGNEYKMYEPGIKYWDGEPNAGDYFAIYLANKLKIDKRSSLAIMGNILSADFIEDTKYFWGCGAFENYDPFVTDVKRYFAVAGKKTLKILSKFGDVSKIIISNPALLASFLYKPKVEKKYKLCLLSHWQDYNLLKDYGSSEVNLIHMKTNDIELILDKINECKFTVSTSLHGLVFSHSYGIKSIKLNLENSQYKAIYKYEDYYSVINKEFKQISLEELNEIINSNEKLQQLEETVSILSPLEILRKQLEFLSVSPVQNIFSNMKNIICTFIKNENEYEENIILEWIIHHINIGYSDIFIINTKETFKNFEDTIDESMKEKVHLFNVLTVNNIQNEVISYFYQYMNRYFESITIIDINKNKNLKQNTKNKNSVITKHKIYYKNKNKLPNGFVLINENIPNGPITVDREKNDGTKRNLYEKVRFEDDNFYYNYENFNKLNETTSKRTEYICEMHSIYRPENLKGHDISCPSQYTIKIDKAFYGRYAYDKEHCSEINNKKLSEEVITTEKDCGYEPIDYLKELCEDKEYCTIVPTWHFFRDNCYGIYKYLHIDYHCIKNLKLRKEKIGIVSFYNKIKVNSVQEHSVNEFYQYANIHGYEFQLSNNNYTPGREIYFMKLNTVIEKIIEGLKYKKYDWIFWVDSDVIIINQNIKLETFLPNDNMNNVHLIAAYDYWGTKEYCCGLNAGIFFIRVHEWSLNLLMRAISYPYFNKEKEVRYSDQTALNNILIESNETEHYVIVPEHWFNKRHIKKGEFLFHIMGYGKDEALKKFLNDTQNEDGWDSKTNELMRKEVLKYYDLPREEKLLIKIQP